MKNPGWAVIMSVGRGGNLREWVPKRGRGWLLMCLFLSLGIGGCTSSAVEKSVFHREERIPVTVETPTGPITFSAELADDPRERARGLMFRESLDPTEGMLFVFPKKGSQSFWMKNVPIPLDLIFITEEQIILGVVHRAEPKTLRPRSVPGESKYVLEIAGGTAERLGIRADQTVRFVVGEAEQ